MLNKNFVIALVAVALLVGGVFFALLNKNSNPSTNSPAATSGELTRDMARRIIMDYYANEPEYSNDNVKNITVTGITMESQTKALVSFDVEAETSGNLVKESSPIPMPLTLYDDGWRVNFAQ